MPPHQHSHRILPEAALWRGRTIGLYGGSFNPAHAGHLHVAKEALKRLDIDALWVMVSPGNPLKAEDGMAPYGKRVASAQAMMGNDPRLTITDIETRLGTRYTADTVEALQKRMPTTRFVWIMGADSLATFDRWQRWPDLVKAVPIAVFDRPGYAGLALAGGLSRRFHRFRVTAQQLSKSTTPAWTFLTVPRHPGSATQIRTQIGKTWLAES